MEYAGQRVVGEREVRRQVNRLLGLGGRLVPLLALGQAQGQQRMGVRIVWFAGERLAQLGFGRVVAALLEEQQAALKVRAHRMRGDSWPRRTRGER